MQSARTVFMFSGQGSHYYQMGRQLLEQDPGFRDCLHSLDEVARRISGKRVLDAVLAGGKADVFDRTLLTHPAIFMFEYALAQRLIAGGLHPDLVLGASLGTFVAAVIAGSVDVEDALAAVIHQAQAFEAHCERGGMIAILAKPALYAEPFLSEHSELAALNFEGHFAVAAALHSLEPIEAELKRRGISHQRLAVSYAFHSRWIDAARDDFRAFMGGLPVRPPRLPLICCARAAALDRLGAEDFWHVVRHPIRFREALEALEAQGPHRYVDLGPSGTLATFVKYALPKDSTSSAHATLTPYGQDARNLAAVLALA